MKKQLAAVAMMTAMTWAAGTQAQAPEIPKPAPENDVIKKSVGTWKCTGSGKGPDGAEMKYTSTWTVKPALNGHWYALTYKRAKMGPMPAFEGQAVIGYNVAEKKYVMTGFDNMGGWIDLSSTDGATYSGPNGGMGKVGTTKFSFTPGKDKKGEESDKLFDVTMEFATASSTESCKK